ncbi:hypothetical protein PEC18_19455 [Paucibacter sp. O1-1]|nr:hypothetical protein [Paucibacter sp. O1-1]MDA3827962.1 hypothetical protein [Paucibacter sp. O1-1]
MLRRAICAHAEALRRATGLPVHDVRTLLHARWQALRAGHPL